MAAHLAALVTGATGTIGRAVSEHLAEAGHAVARTDLTGGAPLIAGDVSDPDDVERICTAAESRVGPIEVLVNVAGTYGDRVPFLDSDPESWWRVVSTNLRGPALLCRRLVPAMVQRGRGLVVNINSRAAVWDDPGQSSVAYSTSKAALARFTSALAGELRGTGVVVLDLSPGMVRSGMTASRPDIDALPDEAFLPASATAQKVSQLLTGRYDALHGRFVHAKDDLDDLVARLARSPDARTLGIAAYGDEDPLA